MTISVAMCTYNGAKYIEKQLGSILTQTHPVDEIVICDDASKDNTLSIIDSMLRHLSIPIRICRNEESLGVRANFNKAIHLCKGDLIFLSDQDDVWAPNKVEVVQPVFL